jgi:glutathione peroxidase
VSAALLCHASVALFGACARPSGANAEGRVTSLATSTAVATPTATRDPSMNIYSLTAKSLEGETADLKRFEGQVTLLVNVASFCGKTPQYTGLERLQQKYQGQGFSVLGFPSNDFGKQEPGSAQEIREFCDSKYRITFPLFEKVQTKAGPEQAPVYAALKQATGELPSWNFGKYLIGRDGKVIRFFSSNVEPDAPELVSALEGALAAPGAPKH